MASGPAIDKQHYVGFMAEIKTRRFAVGVNLSQAANNQASPLAFLFVEMCLLQTRYICELIALAATVAHGDIDLKADHLKSWNAGETFHHLSKINEKFFPQRVSIINSGEEKIFVTQDSDIDSEKLEKIYHDCGKLLHRGKIKDFMHEGNRVYPAAKIARWNESIYTHLKQHAIILPGEEKALLANLEGGKANSVRVEIVDLLPRSQ